jgi:tetratricopeptide (TPR) repeat protein
MKSFNLNEYADLLSKLQYQIDERLSNLRNDAVYSRGRLIEVVDHYNASFPAEAIHLTPSQLRYLIDNQLIQVEIDSNTGDYRFSRKDIVDIVLVQTLRQHPISGGRRLNLLQIKGIREKDVRANQPQARRIFDEDVPSTQLSRGYKYFCSRTISLILTLLVPEKLMSPNLLLIRRTDLRKAHIRNYPIQFKFLELMEVDDIFGDFRTGDLIGDVKPDGEILIPDPTNWRYHSLARLGILNWYYMELNTSEDSAKLVRYEIAIGAPEVEGAEKFFHQPGRPENHELLGLLLKTCFVNLGEELNYHSNNKNKIDQSAFLTPLHVILSVIPKLSKYWNYGAVYISASNFSDQLKMLATSTNYPADLMLNGSRLEKGQLLAGWVFKNNKMMVVQEAIETADPRLRVDSAATAALAVPTWIHDKSQNGVLYIASRKKISEGELPFPPFTQKYFYLLGGILGEYIEREYLRSGGVVGAQQLIGNRNSVTKDWGSFASELEKALNTIKSMPLERLSPLDNLHIVVVRLDDYQRIFDGSPKIAEWLMEQSSQIVDEYYREWKLNVPLSFPYNHMNRVFFIPKVTISDEADRKFRYGLRDLLNSLPLQFSHFETVYPKFYVWSIPYRYMTLHNRLNELGFSTVVIEIVQVIERKLHTLKYVEDAHEHEKRRAYALAYQAMQRAFDSSENDEYIMRHLAKYLFYQQDYTRALSWAEKVAQTNPQPSHLRRLAIIQMCLNDLDSALQSLQRALSIDKNDKKCSFMLGMVYFAAGKYEEAIERFREAERRDSQEDNTLLRFLAQTYFRLEDEKEAQTIIAGLGSKVQDDPDLTWLRWQIQSAQESRDEKHSPGGKHAKK